MGGEESLRNRSRGEFAEREERGVCGTGGEGSLRNGKRGEFEEPEKKVVC